MFKKKMILFSSLLLLVMGFLFIQIGWMRKADLESYENMIQERKIAASNAHSPTNQLRKEVRKDIWFSQDDHCRLHYQIASTGSLLTLTPVGNKFEVVETLQGIRCWMQDKLLKNDLDNAPFQQARLIEAESGIYRHTTQEFIANDVELSLFKLPGHCLPNSNIDKDKAFLSGLAHDISFLFSGKTPQFQARHFEATVDKE